MYYPSPRRRRALARPNALRPPAPASSPARRVATKRAPCIRRVAPASIMPAALVPSKAPRMSKEKRARLEARRAQCLLEEFTPLVRKIAGGFQRKLPRNVLREDLIAAGMSGLWDAIRRHPDGGDESFEWYVRVRIRGAILDELRAQDWLPRRARAAAEANAGTDAYVPPPSVGPHRRRQRVGAKSLSGRRLEQRERRRRQVHARDAGQSRRPLARARAPHRFVSLLPWREVQRPGRRARRLGAAHLAASFARYRSPQRADGQRGVNTSFRYLISLLLLTSSSRHGNARA